LASLRTPISSASCRTPDLPMWPPSLARLGNSRKVHPGRARRHRVYTFVNLLATCLFADWSDLVLGRTEAHIPFRGRLLRPRHKGAADLAVACAARIRVCWAALACPSRQHPSQPDRVTAASTCSDAALIALLHPMQLTVSRRGRRLARDHDLHNSEHSP